jgi:hypothetical protein
VGRVRAIASLVPGLCSAVQVELTYITILVREVYAAVDQEVA